MGFGTIFLAVLSLILIGLNVYAIQTLFSKDTYTRKQIPLLIGVILFVPFVGAGLVLYFAKTNYEGSISRHSSVDDDAQGVYLINNYNIDGTE